MSLHNPTSVDLTRAYFDGLQTMGKVDLAVAEDLGIPTNAESFDAHVEAGRTVAEKLGGLTVEDPFAEARANDHVIYEKINDLTPVEARTTPEERQHNLEVIKRLRKTYDL